MNIPKLIKECHQIAVDSGFYSCPKAHLQSMSYVCPYCKGTGKDPNRNIGEMLMLIVTELSEALEAHRSGYLCTEKQWVQYERCAHLGIDENTTDAIMAYNKAFELCIKDTFESELADVFIRLFDFCGYLDKEYKPDYEHEYFVRNGLYIKHKGNIGETLFRFIYEIQSIGSGWSVYPTRAILQLLHICTQLDIDIEKHIKLKMEYNKTRPYRHGKRY